MKGIRALMLLLLFAVCCVGTCVCVSVYVSVCICSVLEVCLCFSCVCELVSVCGVRGCMYG